MNTSCHPRLTRRGAQRFGGEGKGTQVVPYSRSQRMGTAARSSIPHRLRDLGPLPLAFARTRDCSAGDDICFVFGGL